MCNYKLYSIPIPPHAVSVVFFKIKYILFFNGWDYFVKQIKGDHLGLLLYLRREEREWFSFYYIYRLLLIIFNY